MARRRRLDGDGAVHHVMNRGVNHQPIFFGDVDRVEFGAQLADMKAMFGVETLAYALMTNHFHLLLLTPEGGLSEAMHRLASVYVQRTNARVGRDGPLFRSRFHSIRVTTDAYLAHAARYIHLNPLDLPGVARPQDHRWSSDRTYRGLRPAPPFLNTEPVLSLFDSRESFARFVDEGRTLRCSDDHIDFADVAQLIQLAIGGRSVGALGHDNFPSWLWRTTMLLVADAMSGTALGERLAAGLDFPSSDARRLAIKRARERRTEPIVSDVLAEVLAALGVHQRAA